MKRLGLSSSEKDGFGLGQVKGDYDVPYVRVLS